MRLKLTGGSREFEVEAVLRASGSIEARIDGREVAADLRPLPDGSAILTAAGRRMRVSGARRGHSILVAVGPLQFDLTRIEGRSPRAAHGLASPEVTAPMPGKVLKVLVNQGDRVEAGQPLLVMEAMKMETTLSAEGPAIVKRIRATVGAMVDHGEVLIESQSASGSITA